MEEVIRVISEDLMIEYGTVLTSLAFRYKQVLSYCDFNRLLTGEKLDAVIHEGLSHFFLNSVLFLKTPLILLRINFEIFIKFTNTPYKIKNCLLLFNRQTVGS